MIRATVRIARKLIIFVIGSTALLFGIALIFTPGPALLVIPAALLILATEFVWAKNLLSRIKEKIKKRKH